MFLSETYGILGYDDDLGKNIELMEKGRGSEYGFCGGSGGQGCLVLGYSEGGVIGTTEDFPANASSLMVLADQSGVLSKDKADAPIHYGGITKTTWEVKDGKVVQVP